MKKLFTLTFLLYSFSLFAQPAYDDCPAFMLGEAPNCPVDTIFNNFNATATDLIVDNIPPCWNGADPERDVFISFVSNIAILDYVIELTACPDPDLNIDPILQPQLAVYRGDCGPEELVLLDCVTTDPGESNLQLNLSGLTPGLEYFLRINDWSGSATPNWGAFKLCVKELEDCNLGECPDEINTNCSGTIYDSGGPDGDYGPNENFVYTICPDDFHQCINFGLEYYNLGDVGDDINLYDGIDTNSPLLVTLNGGNFNGDNSGGVCMNVGASSGCITMEFISDGSLEFEGFVANWECTQEPCESPETISVNLDITDQDIINSISTPQTTVTIDTIICADVSIGTFDATGSDLGLEQGLLLTSGDAAAVAGISTENASLNSVTTEPDGDPDLDVISAGNLSNDACVIELDVFAATDELTFEYVFGSEEYPEFVGGSFNDIFAFFISGPGIVGDPAIGNQLNIAVLPDGTPVSVNNVNDSQNWEYYRDNNPFDFGVSNDQIGQSVVYDGLTSDFQGVKKSLTARADVIPCNTYRLKLAVADRGDDILDSGVFISELAGGTPSITFQGNNQIDYLVEECALVPDFIIIDIGTIQEEDTDFMVTIGGTAELGVDYNLTIPTNITIPAGQSSVSFPIEALADGIIEGTETIEITLSNNFGCGDIIYGTLVIDLEDQLDVQIEQGIDTVFVCQGGCVNLSAEGSQEYFWTPGSANFNDPFDQNPEVCPTESMLVFVEGTLGICTDRDTTFLQIIDPQVEIEAAGPTDFCQGDSVQLTAVNNINDANLVWIPNTAITPDQNSPVIQVAPQTNTAYIARVSLEGCSAQDTIQVNVDPFDFPNLLVTDTFICQNYPVLLADPIPFTTTTYQWTSMPNDPSSIDCDTCPDATVIPQEPTVYTIVATSENEYCADTASVTIDVAPANVDIEGLDTLQICLGDSVDLTAITSTGGSGLNWSPADDIVDPTAENIVVAPTETTQYFATLDVGECFVIDSVFIIVDSLPNLEIAAIPDDNPYCEGDEVTLISQTYEPADYPNIDFLWTPMDGQQTPDSNLNLVIQVPVGDTWFVRETTNRGCTSLDSFLITGIPAAMVTISPADTSICPGELAQLIVTSTEPFTEDQITWSPAVDCGNCLDPFVSPNTTTTYTVEIDYEGCPAGASATVEVVGPTLVQFPNPPAVCEGDFITLNTNPDPETNYVWNGGSLNNVTDAAPEVSPTTTTTYNVSVSAGNCTFEQEVTIDVIPDFTFSAFGDATICEGESTELSGVAEDAAGNSVAGTISYVLNGETIGSGTTFLFSDFEAGTYDIEVIFEDAANCEEPQVQVVTVIVQQAPDLSSLIDDTTICEGESIQLNNVTNDGVVFEWTGGELTGTSDQTPTVTPSGTTNYVVSATINGDCEVVDSVLITVIDTLDNFVGIPDTTVQVMQGGSLTFPEDNSQLFNLNGDYTWIRVDQSETNPQDTVFSNENSLTISIEEEGKFLVFVEYENECQILRDSFLVCIVDAFVPNAFTPNGDEENESFGLVTSNDDIEIVSFKVFNRWGNEVYNANSTIPSQARWNGGKDNDTGQPQPSDVYLYRLEYRISSDTDIIVEEGDVTLIR